MKKIVKKIILISTISVSTIMIAYLLVIAPIRSSYFHNSEQFKKAVANSGIDNATLKNGRLLTSNAEISRNVEVIEIVGEKSKVTKSIVLQDEFTAKELQPVVPTVVKSAKVNVSRSTGFVSAASRYSKEYESPAIAAPVLATPQLFTEKNTTVKLASTVVYGSTAVPSFKNGVKQNSGGGPAPSEKPGGSLPLGDGLSLLLMFAVGYTGWKQRGLINNIHI